MEFERYIITNKQGEYYTGWLDSYIQTSWGDELFYDTKSYSYLNADVEICNNIDVAKYLIRNIAKCENQDESDYKILKLKIEISEVEND